MALTTGTPLGNITQQEDLFLEGSPTIFFQRTEANLLFNPDGSGAYWGLSGTSTYPVYELGCITDVALTENLTVNDVLCDNVGVKDTIQQRNYLEFTFTVQSFFPFSVLTHLVKGGTVTQSSPTEWFGMGPIDNTIFWQVYAPKVYSDSVGDYVVIQLHKAKFVNAFTISMPFGSPWQLTGLTLRAFADTTKPAAQRFSTILRHDLSVIT